MVTKKNKSRYSIDGLTQGKDRRSSGLALLTWYLYMVLKWLFLKKTASSPSRMVFRSWLRPWAVSCDAVLSRKFSARSAEALRDKRHIQVGRAAMLSFCHAQNATNNANTWLHR